MYICTPTAKSPSEAISHDLNVFAWIPTTPLFDDEKVVVQRYCSKMNSVFNTGITGYDRTRLAPGIFSIPFSIPIFNRTNFYVIHQYFK